MFVNIPNKGSFDLSQLTEEQLTLKLQKAKDLLIEANVKTEKCLNKLAVLDEKFLKFKEETKNNLRDMENRYEAAMTKLKTNQAIKLHNCELEKQLLESKLENFKYLAKSKISDFVVCQIIIEHDIVKKEPGRSMIEKLITQFESEINEIDKSIEN